jgi:hypothetical protein
MRSSRLHRPWLSVIVVLATVCVFSLTGSAQNEASHGRRPKSGSCSHDDSGLKLPAGFCATAFAEGIGHARHLVRPPPPTGTSSPTWREKTSHTHPNESIS